ncbi:MAG: Holliday junction resolvase RuvX [Proteobacteria bacterium]|nr:Holliday junction resolvase RuvX [Pseudomonadota bacterium]
MPLFNLTDLMARLGRDDRLLGIDPGSKTIGLALSDVRRTLATPYAAIRRRKLRDTAPEIAAIARKEGARGLVVGLPLDMDGRLGPAAQAARDWAGDLSEAVGLPAAMWDERLSSAAANRFLISEADVSHAKRAASVDRLAAAFILQSALDAAARRDEEDPDAGP